MCLLNLTAVNGWPFAAVVPTQPNDRTSQRSDPREQITPVDRTALETRKANL